MTLDLPWPPSVNRYWRSVNGRVLISKPGRLYRQQVAMHVMATQPGVMLGRLNVEVYAYPPDRRRRDIDNILKALLDALEHAGIYENDNQIDRLSVTRLDVVDGGRVSVTLSERPAL